MKLSIYWKMMLGFGIIIVLMLIATAYILNELYDVSETTKKLTLDAGTIDRIKELQSILDDEEGFAQKYLVSGDREYAELFTGTSRHFGHTLDSLTENRLPPLAQRMVRRIEQRHGWYYASIMNRTGRPRGAPAVSSDSNMEGATDTLNLVRQSLELLIMRNESAIAGSIANVETTARRSSGFALALAIGTFCVALTFAFLISRTISRPIDVLVRGTEKIAHGSFEQIHVSSGDEIARLAVAFNRMTASLNAMNALRAEMMQQISHELRVPLQTIYSAHYMLTLGGPDGMSPAQQRFLGSIRESVDKIATFSNRFLDLSKIEAGMMEYTFAPADLSEIVKSAVDLACISATEKGVTIKFEPEATGRMMVDREKCSEIVGNLLTNAIKYTDPGGTITVTVAPSKFGVRIGVTDTGIGVAEDEIPKLFTKFYRASNAVQGRSKGTGLGLALVKALVEGHGGRITVRSTLGEGSTFTVEFPASREPRHES